MLSVKSDTLVDVAPPSKDIFAVALSVATPPVPSHPVMFTYAMSPSAFCTSRLVSEPVKLTAGPPSSVIVLLPASIESV